MDLTAPPLPADDHVEITHLISRYNHAVDAGDGVAFAGLFAADGVLDVNGTRSTGSEELRVFSEGVPVQVPGIRHVASNIVAATDGADGAIGSAYLVVYVGGADGLNVVISGRYEDRYVRVDGSWRFASRAFTAD